MEDAYALNDEVCWGDAQLASHFLHAEENRIKARFSSLIDAYKMASGAASDMLLVPKESKAYQEAEKILDEAMAFVKIFKKERRRLN